MRRRHQYAGHFCQHETALADFALLAEWEQNPNANAAHADVLTSDEWLREFYDNYIETLIEQGEDARAATYKAKRNAYNEGGIMAMKKIFYVLLAILLMARVGARAWARGIGAGIGVARHLLTTLY